MNEHRTALAIPVAVAFLVVALLVVGMVVRSRRHPQIALVGDSITQISEQPLHGRLDGDWDVAVVGIPGATVTQLAGSADAVLDLEPRQVVLELGTNDLLQGHDVGATLDQLRTAVAAYADVPCVHLVTVSESMLSSAGGTDVTDAARRYNEGLRAIAAERGAHVVDWAAVVRDADRTGTGITFDTVHPDEEGQRRLADAYAASLASCTA